MTTARCPLVREIEEDIACNGESFRASVLRERYKQIRAALEAAEECVCDLAALRDAVVEQNRLGATWHPEVFGKMMSALGGANDALARYRAATRTEE